MRFTDPSEMPSFYEDLDYCSDEEDSFEQEKRKYSESLEELQNCVYGLSPFDEKKVDQLLDELADFFNIPMRKEPLAICRKKES